jgi:hypothetical protein
MAKVKVKVISLRQPWAYLFAIGAKKFETRDWQPRSYTSGPLYIHASQKIDFNDLELCRESEHFKRYIPKPSSGILVQGAIIGVTNLIKIHTTESIRETLSEQERAFGNYGDGRFAWETANAKLLETPIKIGGKLSIWDYEMDMDEELADEEIEHEPEPDLNGTDYRETSERMWDCQQNVK